MLTAFKNIFLKKKKKILFLHVLNEKVGVAKCFTVVFRAV